MEEAMSKREKLLERIQNNPRAVRFEEIDLLLEQSGFRRRQASKGSSHYFYTHGILNISIARRTPYLHPKAVKDVLDALASIEKEEQGK